MCMACDADRAAEEVSALEAEIDALNDDIASLQDDVSALRTENAQLVKYVRAVAALDALIEKYEDTVYRMQVEHDTWMTDYEKALSAPAIASLRRTLDDLRPITEIAR